MLQNIYFLITPPKSGRPETTPQKNPSMLLVADRSVAKTVPEYFENDAVFAGCSRKGIKPEAAKDFEGVCFTLERSGNVTRTVVGPAPTQG